MKWFLIVLASLLVLLAIGLSIVATHFSPIIRARAIKILEERYQAKVELKSLTVGTFPRLTLVGEGLELRQHGRTDVPPMVTIQRFTAHAGLRILFGTPVHISSVTLEGLKLTLQPGELKQVKAAADQTAATRGDQKSSANLLVIDEINADGTTLQILPRDSGKDPLEFDIARLRLRSVGKDLPLEFNATLTNARPPGNIESTGHFGPWHSGAPGDTPVDGHYTFTNADLSVFKGISGILSSTGDYRGALNHIDVTGTTDTPDFTVKTGGSSVRLQTSFHAVVDGTNGDTYLQPVTARFLHTVLVCSGKVSHEPGPRGKTVSLNVVTDPHAHIEDLLRLAVKGTPVLEGGVKLQTSFLLPPGKEDVMDKLQLAGNFAILQARFTKGTIQEKLTSLSLRGQGRPREAQRVHDDESGQLSDSVGSNFASKFVLKNGEISLTQLSFEIPGAGILLNGSYGLRSESLNFAGTFHMQAKVSQAFTGWKSALLKAADPFFSRSGSGTSVPIHISGTREHPLFGIDLFRRVQSH